MKIYTSYFKNETFLISNGIVPVAICRVPPKRYESNNIIIIAPKSDTLAQFKNSNDWQRYCEQYMDQLRHTDISKFINEVNEISRRNGDKDIALCCFEEPDKHCHRHLLAEYLNGLKIFDYDIHEITAKDVSKMDLSLELF